MTRARFTRSLLAELYDLEEDAYRLAIREAKRLGTQPPATALRAVAAHANEALVELRGIAETRSVALGTPAALAFDTLRRVRDLAVAPFTDHEHAYRRALGVLRRGIDLVHVLGTAARDECDDDLAAWCLRWQRGREELVSTAAEELDWFARHPSFARLLGTPLPST